LQPHHQQRRLHQAETVRPALPLPDRPNVKNIVNKLLRESVPADETFILYGLMHFTKPPDGF
jgi:hypothetical protein